MYKYVYSDYGIWFDSRSKLWLTDGSMGKSIIIFPVDMSLSMHNDNKKKDILVLAKCQIQGIYGITLTAESQYSIKFSKSI